MYRLDWGPLGWAAKMAQLVKPFPLKPDDLSLLLKIHGGRRKLNSDFLKHVHALHSLLLNKINNNESPQARSSPCMLVWLVLLLTLNS